MEKTGDSCEVSNALKSIDLNSTENAGCAFCQKPNPSKKCSKSHSRCKGKLFCDKNCEMSSHKEEKTKVRKELSTHYSRLPNKRTGMFIDFEKKFQGVRPYLEGVRL